MPMLDETTSESLGERETASRGTNLWLLKCDNVMFRAGSTGKDSGNPLKSNGFGQ
jgi:hypothetical protein